MTRPGPLSSLAWALGALNLLLLAARLPATLVGLGWVCTVLALVASPLAMACAVLARRREVDAPSLRATGRAVMWSGGSLLGQLMLLLVLGP